MSRTGTCLCPLSLFCVRVSGAPLVYFEVFLSQLLYLWWQALRVPLHFFSPQAPGPGKFNYYSAGLDMFVLEWCTMCTIIKNVMVFGFLWVYKPLLFLRIFQDTCFYIGTYLLYFSNMILKFIKCIH